jgi:hypothetical protein
VPGTDKWKPIQENPDAEEAVPGVLIVRIRESLDFGMRFVPASEPPLTVIWIKQQTPRSSRVRVVLSYLDQTG